MSDDLTPDAEDLKAALEEREAEFLTVVTDPRSSMERCEDLVFENLIARYTSTKQFDRVTVISQIYGIIMEERDG